MKSHVELKGLVYMDIGIYLFAEVLNLVVCGSFAGKYSAKRFEHFAVKLGAFVFFLVKGMYKCLAPCADLDQLGIKLDEEKNANAPSGQEVEISAADSKVKIFVVPTNEELVIAREVKRFLENH